MKKILIAFLMLASVSSIAQITSYRSVISGESIKFDVLDCKADEYGKISLLSNTKISVSCEAKVCLQEQSGNAFGVVWGKIYLLEGKKKTFLSKYKGRQEMSADMQINEYIRNKVCKKRKFKGVKL